MPRSPAGSASRALRPGQPLNDLGPIREVAVHAGFTLARTGVERCGLQVLEIITSVGLQALWGAVVVRDAAEQVEQFLRWRRERPGGFVMGHTRIVTESAA